MGNKHIPGGDMELRDLAKEATDWQAAGGYVRHDGANEHQGSDKEHVHFCLSKESQSEDIVVNVKK